MKLGGRQVHDLLRLLLALFLVSLTVLTLGEVPHSSAQGSDVKGPFVGPPIAPVSFDGDVRQLPQPKSPSPAREAPRPLRRIVPNIPTPGQTAQSDPVRQTQMGTRAALAPLKNFDGISATGWYPPDPNGDVGPNHYVQAVNIAIGVYNKTGARLAAFSFNGFFNGTGTPCDNSNQGDPIVLYDPLADRWLVSDFAWSNSSGPFYECVAVSKTSDPVSGGWWLYAIRADASHLNDYPKLGVWLDGYYLSANMFAGTTGPFQGVRVWALDRTAMKNGLAFTPIYFDLPCGTNCYSTLLPANLRGNSPPAGEPEFFASIDAPNVFHLWRFHVDWNTPGNSTFTGPTNLTVASFVMPCNAANTLACVPQQGGEAVDALGDRLMMQLQYRNIGGVESLWANHTVADNSAVGYPTGIRWYEIRDPNGTPVVYQQGTFQPDTNYRWMGSLAVDRQGNMALGYSVSSASMYPAIRYTGRLGADSLGQLPQGEVPLIPGTGSQSGGYNRWGDYTAMTVDPVDDCTFWYTNQYYATTGNNWQTRIGAFKFPSCVTYLYYFPFVSKAP